MYCLRLLKEIVLYALPTFIAYFVLDILGVYGWIPDVTLIAIGILSLLKYIKHLEKPDIYKEYTKKMPIADKAHGLYFPYHKD